MDAMVPVRIVGIHLEPVSGGSVVLLGELDEITRVLPIFIGPAEAQAILLALAGVTPPRPGTHDLTASLMAAAHLDLHEVAVTGLLDGTFLAELDVRAPDGTHQVSARPSDGIALALRVGAPIVVAPDVLDQAAVAVEHEPGQAFSDDEIEHVVEEFQRFLDAVGPADFDLDAQ